MFQQVFQNETTEGQSMAQAIEIIGGGYRNRTGLLGFAIRCIACLPTRHLRRCLMRFLGDRNRRKLKRCGWWRGWRGWRCGVT